MGQFKPPLSAVALPSPPPAAAAATLPKHVRTGWRNYWRSACLQWHARRARPGQRNCELRTTVYVVVHFHMHKCLGNNGNRRVGGDCPPSLLTPPQLLIPMSLCFLLPRPDITLCFPDSPHNIHTPRSSTSARRLHKGSPLPFLPPPLLLFRQREYFLRRVPMGLEEHR